MHTENQKEKILENRLKYKRDGLVCLGNGDTRDKFKNYTGLDYDDIYTDENGIRKSLKSGWSGDSYEYLYYITEEKWNEVFGYLIKDKNNPKSLEETLELAKTFIGKRIKSILGNGTGIVDRVKIVLNRHDSSIVGNDGGEADKRDNYIAENGFAIEFIGTWSNRRDMVRVFDENVELANNTVTINGYTSVDKGDYFEFGCAKISKDLLKAAEIFMTSTFEDDNRKVVSVKIGAGTFTLEDIQTLLS